MLTLNRRTFILGFTAATAALVTPHNSFEPASRLARLGSRRLRPNSTSIRFDLNSNVRDVTQLAVATEADGYFLYHAEFALQSGETSIIKFARRLIPGRALIISLKEDPIRSVVLHHTYLPFSSSVRTMELWG